MASVTVRVFATLRERLGWSERRFEAEVDDIDQLLRIAEGNNITVHELVVEAGRLLPRYKVMLNGRDVEFLDGLKTKVRFSDVVAIFPPIAGG